MGAGQAFLLLETTATTFMAGVLWTMQLLNYPLLALVGRDAFVGYESAHNRRFGLVVIPAALQGRQHAALATGFSEQLHARLVGSNWIRVAAWSAAAGIALWMCHQAFQS